MAGRRGYTAEGYPIVWKRHTGNRLAKEYGEKWGALTEDEQNALIHDACMQKLKERPAKKAKAKRAGKTIGGLPLEIKADKHCIQIILDGQKMYASDLAGAAKIMKKALVRSKIMDRGTVSKVEELIRIEREATKEILGAFDTLPTFEVKEVN